MTECYSALKKKEILPFAATWMNMEDIMPSEISQTPKDKYCMVLLGMWNLKSQTYRSREQNGGSKVGGRGRWEYAGQEYNSVM